MTHIIHNIKYLALFLVITSGILFSGCKKDDSPEDSPYGTNPGDRLPEFSLPDTDGNIVTKNDMLGKIVLVEFWASWCGYCVAEVDELNQMYNDYKDKNFEILGVSLDENSDEWLKSVEKHNIEYTQLIGENGFDSEFAVACGVNSIPKMILVNEEGIVVLVTSEASVISEFLEEHLN